MSVDPDCENIYKEALKKRSPEADEDRGLSEKEFFRLKSRLEGIEIWKKG